MAATDYLCFTALEANSTVSYTVNVYYYSFPYYISWIGYYSLDGETWNSYTVKISAYADSGPHSGTTIKLTNVGDKVYFKGEYEEPNNSSSTCSVNNKYKSYTYNYFKTTGKVAVSGDITTYATNYAECTSDAFKYLFCNSTGLIDASGLDLSVVATRCYYNMFRGCTSLTTPPELPATTLADYCYCQMFSGCTSLVTPPELPATTLADYCYYQMFNGCTGLENPKLPDLKATTLPNYCYSGMFQGCTGIKLSTTQTEEYNTPFRIPTTGSASKNRVNYYMGGGYYEYTYNTCTADMFIDTGGTFTGIEWIRVYDSKSYGFYYIETGTTYYYHTEKDLVPNKVTYGETVLIDLTEDTVKPEYVKAGVTFHTADGQSATGTASTGATSALSGTPGINKVIYNGKTLIDLTADTITPGDVTSGYTFHACDGNQYTGIA